MPNSGALRPAAIGANHPFQSLAMNPSNVSRLTNLNFCEKLLLVLIAAYSMPTLTWGQHVTLVTSPTASVADRHYLSNCALKKDDADQWAVSCDYGVIPYKPSDDKKISAASYTIEVNWIRKDGAGRIPRDSRGDLVKGAVASNGGTALLGWGTGKIAGALRPAVLTFGPSAFVTTSVTVDLVQSIPDRTMMKDNRLLLIPTILASQELELTVNWPDRETWDRDAKVKSKSTAEVLQHAGRMIDAQQSVSLKEAKKLLERLLEKDPKAPQAYVELARIAMKGNWGPEGLRQADALLNSALQIQPGFSNALILRGYIFTHQGRYAEAERALQMAAKEEVTNLWLWSNWGELLEKQGKTDDAIAMHRKAVEHKPTGDPDDFARKNAFERLLLLLEARKDFDGMEALHVQRSRDYETDNCYGANYAQFRLMHRNDHVGAISIAEKSANAGCKSTNWVLGYAYYTAWAMSKDPDRNDLLNKARVYFPTGPNLINGLASSDYTAIAIKQLMAIGEPVDQPDNQGMTALAYALNNNAYETVVRLIRLGAKPGTAIGQQGFPVAFIPIFSKDYEGIRTLKKMGVDYSKLRFQGATANDIAKKIGDPKLIELLRTAGSKV